MCMLRKTMYRENRQKWHMFSVMNTGVTMPSSGTFHSLYAWLRRVSSSGMHSINHGSSVYFWIPSREEAIRRNTVWRLLCVRVAWGALRNRTRVDRWCNGNADRWRSLSEDKHCRWWMQPQGYLWLLTGRNRIITGLRTTLHTAVPAPSMPQIIACSATYCEIYREGPSLYAPFPPVFFPATSRDQSPR